MTTRTTAEYTAPVMAATDANTPMRFAKDFRNAVLTLVAAGFTGTVTVFGSTSEDRPDLDNASSAINLYAPINVINLDDSFNVEGTTGIVFT